jgi:hypothetical protein
MTVAPQETRTHRLYTASAIGWALALFWSRATFGDRGAGADEPVDNPGEESGRRVGNVATVGGGSPSGPTLPVRACITAGFRRAASGGARGDDAGGVRATDGTG